MSGIITAGLICSGFHIADSVSATTSQTATRLSRRLKAI